MMQKLKALKGYAYGVSLAATSAMGLLAAKAASALTTVNDIDTSGITDSSSGLILGTASPVELAVTVINWVLGLLALVAVVLILIGGFRWMTAGGNEEKVEGAKKTLYAALIGLVIILAGWGVSVYVINNLLNFTGA